MINRDIVIAILARDCERTLPNNIRLIEELRTYFVWSKVVVVENDSKDTTKKILFDWKKKKQNVEIISRDYNSLTIPITTINSVSPLVSLFRIEKMTKYRNIYIDYIQSIEHNIDNVIVIDIDIESFSIKGVLNSILKCEKDCGAIFAYGITVKKIFNLTYSKIFYDVFAVQEYKTTDIAQFKSENSRDVLRNISTNLKTESFHKVISAFGGLAVYNYKAISQLQYKTESNSSDVNEAICEHIPFNRSIIQSGFSNYISKDMEVIYGKHGFIDIMKYIMPKNIFNFLLGLSNKFIKQG